MNNSSTSNDDTHVQLITNNSSSSADEMGPSTKKRKLTMGEMSSNNIELELLQAANEKWKQYAKKLESEKHIGCDQQKILELQDTISNLEEMCAELKVKNEKEKNQHKNEMDSIINEYTAKIQTFEAEKQKFKSKIEEFADKISTMKNIKTEINDSVENERENVQAEKDALVAEITDAKQENRFLTEANQNLLKLHESEIQSLKLEKEKAEVKMEEERKSFQSTIFDSENQRKEIEKKLGETAAKNQQLEALVNKSVTEYQSTIDGLKADNQNLSKVNSTLKNNEKTLQNSVDEFKKKIEKMEKNEPEMKSVSLNEIFDGAKLKTSLLSCKSNIAVNVTKITGASEGWKLYSTTTNVIEIPHFLTQNYMFNTCFKMNITDELQASYGQKLQEIMPKINTCKLTKLHLISQTVDLKDYIKLTSSKTIQICTLEDIKVVKDRKNFFDMKECNIVEILSRLPNIKEFKYVCELTLSIIEQVRKNLDLQPEAADTQKDVAKDLGQLQAFPNLQKFEISNLTQSFKLEDLETFIKKNNKDAAYIFSFSGLPLAAEKEIKKTHKKLLKSLSPHPYKIQIEFKLTNLFEPVF